jgi:ATP-dependent Clp protease adaptor protein ClpS
VIPETIIKTETKEETSLDSPWRVIVLNDPVNLMNYVVMVFKRVLGFDDSKATKHMREVHEKGRSVVWTGEREKAENFAFQLQHWHLQTILEKDD